MLYINRRIFMEAITKPERRGSTRKIKYRIPESKKNYIYESFYKYMINKYNDIDKEIICRNFNIYIDRYYYYDSLLNIVAKYDIFSAEINKITQQIEDDFDIFYNKINPNTIASLNLDTRMYNWLSWTGKFDVYNDDIKKLYDYSKEFYLKKIPNFGQKSFNKLNKSLIERGYPEIQ